MKCPKIFGGCAPLFDLKDKISRSKHSLGKEHGRNEKKDVCLVHIMIIYLV
jgi:hypothetical protein